MKSRVLHSLFYLSLILPFMAWISCVKKPSGSIKKSDKTITSDNMITNDKIITDVQSSADVETFTNVETALNNKRAKMAAIDSSFQYSEYIPKGTELVISRSEYKDRLYGFWLGQCIGNWTGLVTEMDKIGNIGEKKQARFIRVNWGKPDLPSIWGEGVPSDLSENIDFVFENEKGVWGADADQ